MRYCIHMTFSEFPALDTAMLDAHDMLDEACFQQDTHAIRVWATILDTLIEFI